MDCRPAQLDLGDGISVRPIFLRDADGKTEIHFDGRSPLGPGAAQSIAARVHLSDGIEVRPRLVGLQRVNEPISGSMEFDERLGAHPRFDLEVWPDSARERSATARVHVEIVDG